MHRADGITHTGIIHTGGYLLDEVTGLHTGPRERRTWTAAGRHRLHAVACERIREDRTSDARTGVHERPGVVTVSFVTTLGDAKRDDRELLMNDRERKRAEFTRLHRGPRAFVMPNAWDAGTARILEGLGFSALATTSAGLALSLGVRDSSGSLSRRQVLDNASCIVEATSLPVSADLEGGFGDAPSDCARTVREAGGIGLCGGSIEDATGDPARPIHDFELAVERVAAAVEAKPGPDFLITARAENYLHGRPDLDDTVRRLQAFEAVGADVVYAPGLPDIACVRELCRAVTVPVNVVVGLTRATWTVDELSDAGVRRISTGGALARAALGELIRAARELRELGTYGFAARAVADADIADRMRIGNRPER